VGHGALVVVDVEVGGEVLPLQTGDLAQRLAHPGEGTVEGVGLDDDLEPVAGGQDERLGDVLTGMHAGREVACALRTERGALEQLDGGRVVGQPDDQDAHPTSSPLASASSRWCSWKARICSSVARSTARTWTPSGTRSTTG